MKQVHRAAVPFVSLLSSSALASTVVLSHVGTANPVTEGWQPTGPASDCEVGPIVSGEPPLPAWFVDDDSSVCGAGYSGELTPCQDIAADASGWSLKACLRVLEPTPGPISIWIGYNTLSRRFDLWFTRNALGQTVVQLMTDGGGCAVYGSSVVADDGTDCGSPEFHHYELRFDANTQTADLFIDGVEAFSEYPGHPFALSQIPGIGWGAGSSCGDGYGEYHSVEFVIHTDPSPDLNGDGAVDGADLGLLLAAWGGAGCVGDLNLDGVIDGADLGLLLAAWNG